MATTQQTHPVPSIHNIIENIRRHKALTIGAAVAMLMVLVVGVGVSANGSSAPADRTGGAEGSVVTETIAPAGPVPLLLDGTAFSAALAEAVAAVSIPTASEPVSALLDGTAFADAVDRAVTSSSVGFNDAIEAAARRATSALTVTAVGDVAGSVGSEGDVSALLTQSGSPPV